MFPLWFDTYIAITVFLFGAIIGSFLNVVIYRFHTGRSINGNSHCMSCQHQLRWFELFPLISYIALRGACRTCRAYIPPRYFVVEALTGFLFLLVYKIGGSYEYLFLSGILLALLIVVSVYDLNHFIIPDELVILISIVAVFLSGVELYHGAPFSVLIPALGSALGAFLFYGGLWRVSHGRWLGFGDVKLSAPLAFIAGFPATFSMIILSFWVGAVISIMILGIQKLFRRGQVPLRFLGADLTMKSEIPFAPFLVAGFLLAHFYGVDVLSLVSYVF